MIDEHLNKIYNMDCLEFMKTLPDKCIDLVLTDPPYGIGASTKTFTRQGKQTGKSKAVSGLNYKHYDWDNETPSQDIFNEIIRISKNQIIFGGNYFNLPPTSCWLVWDKDNRDNLYADCELAWTSFKTAVRKIKYRWHGMLQQNMKEKEVRFHPTQKPVDIMKWILEKYSDKEQVIFDPFLGSGTVALACKNMERNYIGCEINKEYFEIAQKRLDNVPQSLF